MENIQDIKISKLELNKGQVEGLPKNPRFIRDERYKALVKSIEDAPEMLKLRELLVVEHGNKFVVIGGNMRLRACKELGMETVPCKVLPADTPVAKLREYAIKDNNGFGEDDWDILANEWDAQELQEWGQILPTDWYSPRDNALVAFSQEETFSDSNQYLEQQRKKKGWGVGDNGRSEKRCNLVEHLSFHVKMETSFHASFNTTQEGFLLFEIKEDFDNVSLFARSAIDLIEKIGLSDVQGYAIVSAPKRRHKENNFADCVCEQISAELGIPYKKDLFVALNSDRIHPKFEMCDIDEQNVIFYDDILTTGSTMLTCYRMLKDYGIKNIINIIGINNT